MRQHPPGPDHHLSTQERRGFSDAICIPGSFASLRRCPLNDHDEFEVEIDGYFAILPEWILDADISDRAVRLYAVLRRYADGKGRARPSRAKLAIRLRCSLSSVKRGLKELQDIGSVTVRQRYANASFTSFSYVKDATHQAQAANGYVLHSSPRNANRVVTAGPPTPVTAEPGSTDEPGVGPQVDLPGGSRVDHESKPGESKPEKQTSSSVKPPRKAEPKRDDVESLCAALADGMVGNGCKRPAITDAWRREARLLLDADGRDHMRTLRLIQWCQADSFWASNIHSMAKFRKQYDQLRMRANEQHANGQNNTNRSPVSGLPITRGDQKLLDTYARGEALKARFAEQRAAQAGQTTHTQDFMKELQ